MKNKMFESMRSVGNTEMWLGTVLIWIQMTDGDDDTEDDFYIHNVHRIAKHVCSVCGDGVYSKNEHREDYGVDVWYVLWDIWFVISAS